MATKKEKDKKGPSTQRTGTVGVNAVGINHGMTRQEAVKPTPQQAMAQLSQTVAPQQPQQVNYSPGFTDVPGSPSYQQYGPQQAPVVAQPAQQQVRPQTNTNVQQNPVVQPTQTAPATNGYTYEQAAEGMKRFHGNVDLYHRPIVSSEAMNKAGYSIPSGNTATVYSMQRGIRDANGNVREILYTPISADGQVMSQRDIDAYIDSLDGSNDILAADRAGRNMIIHMDANPNGNDGQDLHLMQEAYGRGPQQQPVQQQQFAMPQQIALPNGQTINLQLQPQQQQQQVRIGNAVVDVPVGPAQTAAPVAQQQPAEKSAAQQNAEYERQRVYNQAVDEYLKAGGNYNAVRPHGDVLEQTYSPEDRKKLDDAQAKAKEQTDADAKKRANGEDDEYVKTLKEYLDSKYESPEDKEAREKREARQRRFAAISEGLANVFNVGGAVAGAQPAQWKSGVGELYANQEAEADKRRLEYREALKDMITYRNAVRNGDIAQARAIEEKRKNDWLEYKMLHDQENKAAEQELKKKKQEADIKRNDQQQTNRNEEHKAKMQGTWNPSGGAKGSSKSGGSGKSKGRGRSGGSRATGAAAAKSAKAAAKRRAKAATQGTKFGKK